MTIGRKLYSGVGAALGIALVMGIVAIYNMNVLGGEVDKIVNISVMNLFLTTQIDSLAKDYVSRVRGINLSGHTNDIQGSHDMQEMAAKDSQTIKQNAEEFVRRTTHADLRQKMQTQVLDKLDAGTELTEQDYELVSKGNLAAADVLERTKLIPLVESMSKFADDLSVDEYKVVQDRAVVAVATVGPARMWSIVMMLLSAVAGTAVMWVVRNITGVLRGSIIELRDSADQVANAASQVSSSSQSLAQGSSEQAASLEETSASSEEINSMAKKNTDNSRSTAELLTRSNEKVQQANHHLDEMVVSMNLITDSSGKISRIIKVIDEIAFQTNILALNAAVEAARAGEAGMGFAVVADEVRSLAQRSAQAAKDTAALIEDSISRAGEGKLKVDQVAQAIQAVTEDSTRVKVMVDEVSLGSEEQSRGIDQIGRAISQMEQVTQTTAANAEESAAAAEQLSAQSEALKDVIGSLQAMVGGEGTTTAKRMGRTAISTRASVGSSSRSPGLQFKKPSPTAGRSISREFSATKKKSTVDEFPLEENFQSF